MDWFDSGRRLDEGRRRAVIDRIDLAVTTALADVEPATGERTDQPDAQEQQ